MNFVVIGGKGATTIENLITKKISGTVVKKYLTVDGFVSSLDTFKTLDRILLMEDGIRGNNVNDFNAMVGSRFPTAKIVIIIVSDASLAKEMSDSIYSPYAVVTYMSKARLSNLLDLCTLPVEHIKKKYGIEEEYKDVMVEEIDVIDRQPKEKSSHSGGLFSKLKGKLERKKKVEESEKQIEQEGYEQEELEEVSPNEGNFIIEEPLFSTSQFGNYRENKNEVSFDDIKEGLNNISREDTYQPTQVEQDEDDFLSALSARHRHTNQQEEELEEPQETDMWSEKQKDDSDRFGLSSEGLFNTDAFKDTTEQQLFNTNPVQQNQLASDPLEKDDYDPFDVQPNQVQEQQTSSFTLFEEEQPSSVQKELNQSQKVHKPIESIQVQPMQEPEENLHDSLNKVSVDIDDIINQAVQGVGDVEAPSLIPSVADTMLTPENNQNQEIETIGSVPIFGDVEISGEKDTSNDSGLNTAQDLKGVIEQTITEATKKVTVDKMGVLTGGSLIEPTLKAVEQRDLASASLEGDFGDVLAQVETLQKKEERERLIVESNTRDKRANRGTKFIIVTGDRYSGKTTTALKLAQLYARNVETLYVDFDVERKGSLVYLGIEQVLSTATEVQLQSISKLTRVNLLSALSFFYERGNFHCLLTAYGNKVTDEQIAETQQLLTTQKDYSIIIIDCPMDKLHLLGDVGVYSSIITCTYSGLNALMNTLEGLISLESKDSRLVAHIYKNMDYLLTDNVDISKFKENMLYIQDLFDMYDDILNWTTNDVLGYIGNLAEIYKHI